MPFPRFLLFAVASGGLPLVSGQPVPKPEAVTVGCVTDSYPYSYRESPDGADGFCTELFDHVAARAGLLVTRQYATGAEIGARFQHGDFDCLQQFTIMPARLAYAEFTSPVLVNPSCAIVRRDSGIRRAQDFSGKRVLYVIQRFPAAAYLEDNHVSALWEPVETTAEALRKISAGQADAIFMGRLTALPLIDHLQIANLTALDLSVSSYHFDMAFAVHRGNAALLTRLNEGLMQVERSGEYDALVAKWFGRYERRQINRDQVLTWGAVLLSAAFLGALWALLRQRALHRELEERTREVSGHRALLQALYDNIPTGMTVIELNGPEPAVLSMNREAVRLYGNEAAAHLRHAAHRHTARPGISHYEWVFPQSRRMFAVTLVPLSGAAGAPPRLCVLAEDVTARRHADAEIAQSRKMRAVGELVGGIAHEFNNLLTPILLKVGEIGVMHAQNPELARDLDVIADAARRGAELTRRLLTFGRKNETGSESIRLSTVVDACFHLLRSTVDRRIQWENAVPVSLPPLRYNATDINQVLINLLINARDTLMEKLGKAPSSDWQPRIRVSALPAAADAHPLRRAGSEGAKLSGWQILSVTDNGMGMPPEVSERIFEPFFTTKGVGQGTGLGLATAWHVVSESGGRIEVESAPGEGTTFRIYFPVWDAEPITGLAQLVKQPAPDAAMLRVLLVEDDPLVAKAMTAMLKRQRHKVESAADGLEAERIIRAGGNQIDLIVLDVNLPGVDGKELARRARLSGYGGRILVTSGRVDDELKAALDEVGVDGVLPKPFTAAQLDAALRACMAV
ncbi:MAG TPA: transporter substrate-binding domain-containing protein [Opitutaceae bacterium]